MYKSLPSHEKTFTIEVEGDVTGIKYEGTFRTKCALSIRDKQAIELLKSRFTQDTANPSTTLFAMASIVAHLQTRLIEFPDWWKEVGYGSDLLDENVLIQLFDKCEELATEWRKSLKPKDESEDTESQGNGKKEK